MAQQSNRSSSVVDQTAHYGFFKITIPQGIEIDPRHPERSHGLCAAGKAGRRSIASAISSRRLCPISSRKARLDPGIVTQLADIGEVQAFPPAPLADVLISREALALRTNVAGVDGQHRAGGLARAPRRALPEVILSKRRPESGDGRSPAGTAGSARASERPDEKVVVLVWVCRPHPG